MTSILLIVISKARVNIEVEEAPKIVTAEVISKVLREIYIETTEISFRKEVIPKTFNSITLRDTGFVTDQGIGPRSI
jgi:hypothetical protein